MHQNRRILTPITSLSPSEKTRKQILFNQVARSTLALKLRKFANPNSTHPKSSPLKETINLQMYNGQQNQKQEEGCRTFSAFMRRKRMKNPYINGKMLIFGNMLSERSKANLHNKIKYEVAKIAKIDKRVLTKQQDRADNNSGNFHMDKTNMSYRITRSQRHTKSSGSLRQHLITQKNIKFTICHIILDNFLNLLARDPQNILLKHKNHKIYNKLKNDMLDILLNIPNLDKYTEIFVSKDIKDLSTNNNKDNDNNNNEKFNSNNNNKCKKIETNYLKEIQKRRKPFYFFNKEKKDQLGEQILGIIEKFQGLLEEKMREIGLL